MLRGIINGEGGKKRVTCRLRKVLLRSALGPHPTTAACDLWDSLPHSLGCSLQIESDPKTPGNADSLHLLHQAGD